MKACRLHITRYLCGKPLRKPAYRLGLTRGFPSSLIFLKRYIDSGNVKEIKFTLTLLNITRGLHPQKDEDLKVDYDSITKHYGGKKYYIPYPFIIKYIKDHNLTG